MEQLHRDFEEQKKDTFTLTQSMTAQYKGMQEQLLAEVLYLF
jgi:hypothetical protein